MTDTDPMKAGASMLAGLQVMFTGYRRATRQLLDQDLAEYRMTLDLLSGIDTEAHVNFTTHLVAAIASMLDTEPETLLAGAKQNLDDAVTRTVADHLKDTEEGPWA